MAHTRFGVELEMLLNHALFSAVVLAIATAESVELDVDYDLPTSVLPTAYHISLKYTLDSRDVVINGTTTIRAMTVASTDRIVFHVGEHLHVVDNVTVVSVNSYEDDVLYVINTTWMPRRQTMEVLLSRELAFGEEVLITANHTTSIVDNPAFMSGMDNDEVYVTTRFQPINARHAFPCFDEPGMKAVFHVSVELDSAFAPSTVVLHNTAGRRSTTSRSWTFDETPIMSTNLLVVVVDQVNVTCHGYDEVFCVWQKHYDEPFDKPDEFLSTLVSQQSTIETFFGMSSLARYHVYISGHEHMAYSAVESWGLVVVNRFAVRHALYTRDALESLMAHELMHYWTGNLVSPRHWRHVWLSEGLTSYLVGALFEHDHPIAVTTERGGKALVSNAYAVDPPSAVYDDALVMLYKLRVMIGERALHRLIVDFVHRHAHASATSDEFIDDVRAVLEPFDLVERQRVVIFLEDALYMVGKSAVTTRHRDNDRSFMITATNEHASKLDCLLTRSGDAVSLYWLHPRESLNLDDYIVFEESRLTYDVRGRWFLPQMCQRRFDGLRGVLV